MSQLIQVTSTGIQHGMLKKYANSVSEGFKNMAPETKSKAEKLKKHNSEIIKARYLNKDGAGERLAMVFCLGAGDPIQEWNFIHGHTYDVPRGLVEQVNNKKTIRRADRCDEKGDNPSTKDEFEEPQHQFVGLI